MEPSELNVDEDSTVHSQSDYLDMLKNLDEEHRSTGGVKFVTNCFGIIGRLPHLTLIIIYSMLVTYSLQICINNIFFTGFIKFLGPYYMLIITEQRKIGDIFGHPVYQVTKTAMIELSNSNTRPKLINSKDENRCAA
jgi:phosphatidylinositol 3,5-bisphosphate 5-phosphatase